MISLPSSSLPSVFGHISFRSDWELVKVDFRPSFSRQCSEEDYGSWDLTDLKVGRGPGWGRRWPPLPVHPLSCMALGASPPRGPQNPSSPEIHSPLAGFPGPLLVPLSL